MRYLALVMACFLAVSQPAVSAPKKQKKKPISMSTEWVFTPCPSSTICETDNMEFTWDIVGDEKDLGSCKKFNANIYTINLVIRNNNNYKVHLELKDFDAYRYWSGDKLTGPEKFSTSLNLEWGASSLLVFSELCVIPPKSDAGHAVSGTPYAADFKVRISK